MTSTLLFPIIFLLFGAAICWIIIGCKGWWAAKFWFINICCIFVFILWMSIISYMGWGVPIPLPDKFRLVSFCSNEPETIYVLTEKVDYDKKIKIKEIFDYRDPDGIRLYKIPYNKKFHEQLEQAMEKVVRGAIVIGSRTRLLDADEINGMGGDDNQNGPTRADGEHGFYILPPTKMFTKPAP